MDYWLIFDATFLPNKSPGYIYRHLRFLFYTEIGVLMLEENDQKKRILFCIPWMILLGLLFVIEFYVHLTIIEFQSSVQYLF